MTPTQEPRHAMTDTTNAVPNPGSPEAVAKGCTCPILDNAHGGGYMGMPGMFVMTYGCPLHSPTEGRNTMTCDKPTAVREETNAEHIARDMREGRFPERSPRQQVSAEPAWDALRVAARDMVEAWDWWTADEYDRCQGVVADAVDDLRLNLAAAPAPIQPAPQPDAEVGARRIADVPPSETLIDSLSDEDLLADVEGFIECGELAPPSTLDPDKPETNRESATSCATPSPAAPSGPGSGQAG